jgi:D-alanyl-D-alanine carboxypeptidase
MRKLAFLVLLGHMLVFTAVHLVTAQAQLSSNLGPNLDKIATDTLATTGVPSVSLAVVQDGQVVYLKAYGQARLEPTLEARPDMRYSIGSISKQFTAAAVLLLAEQGKLSLDDKVAKFLPRLTRANEVMIRQLLSHTSGYQDYWPQDYVMPEMLEPVTPQQILDKWARKPLDFDPGTKWQYSNTNYVIAGLIVEQVSGMPLLDFLQQKIFTPLAMSSVANVDKEKLGGTDASGYMRYALGPLRPAPKEGPGWLFAAGELAMPVGDLAKWDISMMNRTLLKPASYDEMERAVVLKNGIGTDYGLGLRVRSELGHRALSHGGEVSGFTAHNLIFPDERVAIATVTNQDAVGATQEIARAVARLLLANDDPEANEKLAQARKIFLGLEHGTIDRSLFTENANFYFSEQALKDIATGLESLGTPEVFVQTQEALRGGMKMRIYEIRFPNKILQAWTYEMPDGKLEQYQLVPWEP